MVARRKKTILRLVGFALIFSVILSLGFGAGYNFYSFAENYYTDGFVADYRFLPRLFSAYFRYKTREPALVHPRDHEALVQEARKLRIGLYRPWPGYSLPLYEAMTNLDLNVRIVEPETATEELVKEYDLIVFPQGGYTIKQLPPGEDERLRNAVAQGVDYVGICAGAYLAVDDLKLAEVEQLPLDMVSLLWVRTLDVDFWGDLRNREFQAHLAGGGFFPEASLSEFQPLVSLRNVGPMAIAGRYMDGNVVLFGFHPEGGGLTRNNQSVYFSGADLGSGVLLIKVLAELADGTL